MLYRASVHHKQYLSVCSLKVLKFTFNSIFKSSVLDSRFTPKAMPAPTPPEIKASVSAKNITLKVFLVSEHLHSFDILESVKFSLVNFSLTRLQKSF